MPHALITYDSSQLMKQTGRGRSAHDMTYQRNCPGLLLLIMRNITKILSQDSHF